MCIRDRAKVDEGLAEGTRESRRERLLCDVLSEVQSVEEKRADLKVVWKIEASWPSSLGQTQDSIGLLGDAKLLRDKEEVKWIHTQREGLETDLILNCLTLNMHK